jgi:hypothetical protein
MTTDEKRKLGAGLCHLSPEDLSKALELVAQDNPSFQTTAEEVELDMDAQVNFLYLNPNTASWSHCFLAY